MGKLTGAVKFTGRVGDLVAYKRHDLEGIFVMQISGPSKEAIATKPAYERTRRNISEFGGRGTSSHWIRQAMSPQLRLHDYNFTSELNKIAKPIQELDEVSAWGKRSVLFTKSNGIHNGFNLCEKTTFDSIVRNPVSFSVSKEMLSASVHIPALLPGINFFVPLKVPMYKITAALGIVPDLHHNGDKYAPVKGYTDPMPVAEAGTAWNAVLGGSAAETLEMKQTFQPPDENFILLLSIGIRFGNMVTPGDVKQVKRGGAAKILMTI